MWQPDLKPHIEKKSHCSVSYLHRDDTGLLARQFVNHRVEVHHSWEQNTSVQWISEPMEVADMDWETAEEEQLFQDLDRSDQSRHFSSKGQNELQSEDEKSEVEKERKDLSVFQNILAKEDLDFSSQLNQIQDILAAGKAAARSSAAASSAAQEASIAAAAAAENAKAALEEVEKLVNILEGHKCHQQMSLKTTKMSSQKDINGFAHLGSRTYRFPRVFGDEFGDEFGDSLNFVSKLVTHLVMISVNHCIW